MAYDILKDELYDKTPRRAHVSTGSGRKGRDKIAINPFLIHTVIIILLLGIAIFLLLYFFSGKDAEKSGGEIMLIGDLVSFKEAHSGDLEIKSSRFLLETATGRFGDRNKKISITGFEGEIMLANRSIILEGKAEKIEYDDNEINLAASNFKLTSPEKTEISLYFDELELEFKSGRVRINKDLQFSFKKSNASLKNYTALMSYDGTFSFLGPATFLELISSEQGISIVYET